MIGFIYRIRNIINDKCYIGSTGRDSGYQRRWTEHRRNLRDQKHHSPHLQHAWNKYGADSFAFEIIEECPAECCIEREQFYLDTLLFASASDDRFNQLGYNMTRTARGLAKGYKMSKETRNKMSIAHTGKKKSLETRQRMSEVQRREDNPRRGRKLSQERRQQISNALCGRRFSDETKKKISDGNRGIKNGMAKLTIENILKIKEQLLMGVKGRVIAKTFAVSTSTISEIKNNKRWSDLT